MTRSNGCYERKGFNLKERLWLAVLFLIFCAMRELIRIIGKDKFIHLFFGGRKQYFQGEIEK